MTVDINTLRTVYASHKEAYTVMSREAMLAVRIAIKLEDLGLKYDEEIHLVKDNYTIGFLLQFHNKKVHVAMSKMQHNIAISCSAGANVFAEGKGYQHSSWIGNPLNLEYGLMVAISEMMAVRFSNVLEQEEIEKIKQLGSSDNITNFKIMYHIICGRIKLKQDETF